MRSILVLAAVLTFPVLGQWTTVGGNAQHTGLSNVAGQAYNMIKWQTPVDVATPVPNSHYGAPIITAGNSVYVPVHTGSGYQVEVHNGSTGAIKTTLNSGWTPPASGWVPSFGPGLSARNVFYMPDANGTVSYVSTPDAAVPTLAPIPHSFYGTGSGDLSVIHISTPIVSDRFGDIFFGFIVESTTGTPPRDQSNQLLVSGIARISYTGVGSWVSALAAANNIDATITHIPINSAPALANDSQTLYFAVSGSTGYLVQVANSSTMPAIAQHSLIDPNTSLAAGLPDLSSASPVVGPDGDVYYGVFETSCCSHHDRGWLLHFDQHLSSVKIPGSFGWDSTPSIVPANLVSSYHGTSSYLIFSKYNNYTEAGGDGVNKIAILDPFNTEADPIIPAVLVMNEVITIAGITPDPTLPMVREWCINSAAIDKANKSAIVNSEDGTLYRWDFTTNTLSQSKNLTSGVGEAYTPTVIGPDGTVYAINNKVLFAITAH